MPRPKPAAVPPQPPAPAASRYAIAFGAIAVTAGTIASSLRPGSANWGLHAAGFLDPNRRNFLLITIAAAAGFVAYQLLGPPAARPTPRPARHATRNRALLGLALVAWLLVAAALPVKEALLGDSAILIQEVDSGTVNMHSEPLSVRILDWTGRVVKARGGVVDFNALAMISRIAGIGAGFLLILLAAEIGGAAPVVAAALLLTLGATQFYYGYIETYPIALVFVLLYLWLALRAIRGAAPLALVGVVLAITVTSHVTALLLFPSYVYLIFRAPTRTRRLIALVVPLATLAVAYVLLRYDIKNLAVPFRVATQGASSAMLALYRRPYGVISIRHAQDVVNAVLLAAPVAMLLALGGALALPRRPGAWPPAILFLALAAIPGVVAVAGLMTPVAPAQDWDLFTFLLAPAALFGIAVAATAIQTVLRGRTGWSLAALSAALFVPFALVNADSLASSERFAMVVGDPSRVSAYGRSYANEILYVHYREHRDPTRALQYAEAAYQAEPTNPRYSVNVGFMLLAMRRVEEAIPYFKTATAAAPNGWAGPYNLGLSYSSLRRYPEALDALREAMRRNPDEPEIWSALVHALLMTGREDSADVVYQGLKARWPKYVEDQEREFAARQGTP